MSLAEQQEIDNVCTLATLPLPIQETKKLHLGCTLSSELDCGPGSHWKYNQQAQTWLQNSVILKRNWLLYDELVL